MVDENCDWIFVNMIPLLCDKIRIVKQQKIETWLNLHQLITQLGLANLKDNENRLTIRYVV